MEDDKFEELIECVREGIAVINGKKLPSRSFQVESDYPNTFWKKIRIFLIRIFRFDSM